MHHQACPRHTAEGDGSVCASAVAEFQDKASSGYVRIPSDRTAPQLQQNSGKEVLDFTLPTHNGHYVNKSC